MNSENKSALLSLGPVLDLFQAFSYPRRLANDINTINIISVSNPTRQDVCNETAKSPHLGDFDKIWRHLGKYQEIEIPKAITDGLDDKPCDLPSTPGTSPADNKQDDGNQYLEYFRKSKGVRWKDEAVNSHRHTRACSRCTITIDGEGLNLPTLKQPLPLESGTVNGSKQGPSFIHLTREDIGRSGDEAFGSEADLPRIGMRHCKRDRSNNRNPRRRTANSNASEFIPSMRSLTPAWVTPPPAVPDSRLLMPPPVSLWPSPTMVNPTGAGEDKVAVLIKKLDQRFGSEPGSLANNPISTPLQLGGNVTSYGIHVFVDCSNIIIGFYDEVKLWRRLSAQALAKKKPFSFHSLALVMERGRPVAKRVLVGSSDGGRLPEYIKEAERCGYEVSVLKRVEKAKARHQRGSSSYGTSGQSSGSETLSAGNTRVTEQGVDEILHMKMLESIVDYEPSTMVLATGDAAEAEYSGGFLVMVERALTRGWKVELVAWTKSMSKAWVSEEFTQRWRDRFRLVELDDYGEELFETSDTTTRGVV